jgi:hypothetical protein
MELARHHDADLTFGRHDHTRLEDLSVDRGEIRSSADGGRG